MELGHPESHIPFDPASCFVEVNQTDIMCGWAEIQALMRELVKVVPPAVVLQGSYVGMSWFLGLLIRLRLTCHHVLPHPAVKPCLAGTFC